MFVFKIYIVYVLIGLLILFDILFLISNKKYVTITMTMTSSEKTYSSTQYSILEFSIDDEFEIKLRIVKG